jgi:hypothetical protein
VRIEAGGPVPNSPSALPSAATRSDTPLPAASSHGDYLAQAAELYDELAASAQRTIDALEAALRAEAHVMARALAAAADQFFGRVVRTNDASWEYEKLCGPNRREIWPAAFDGGTARMAGELSELAESARAVIADCAAVAEFWSMLRRPPGLAAPSMPLDSAGALGVAGDLLVTTGR